MCTVTFIRQQQQIFFTSNRDEALARPSALMPSFYTYNDAQLLYPKDPQGQGTWFAVNKNGTLIILLNGAEAKHELATSYRLSRGIIVLELVSAENAITYFREIDLLNIEPFTIVCFYNNQLYQLRWNGVQKSCMELNDDCYIWSSSTLYSEQQIAARQNYFNTYFADAVAINSKSIFDFHLTPTNAITNILLNIDNAMLTKNVTQLVVSNNAYSLLHTDLITNQQKHIEFAKHES